jgi:uncharacterized membrane protein YfcA
LKLLLLLLTAVVGGAANALAGGGTFLVFPAMLLAGVPSVVANATASLIMMPGAIASAWVYRSTFGALSRTELIRLTIVSLVGSAVGSILLLSTSNSTFSELVPWLLLMAAVVLTLAPRLRAAAAKSSAGESAALLLAGQFVIGVYGGYFGAGMGVLMIALFLIASSMTVQTANGIRLICGSAINVLAVILFAWRGALDYKLGIPMLFAAIAGGYVGALLVSRLKESTARNAILTYAWALTIWFFARQFHVL